MIIFLLRHGETTGDVENRYGGDYDDDLTALGRIQSAKLGIQLADKQIDTFYTSPRKRALQAASIVGEILGLSPQIIEEFRERNGYGILTGMNKEDAVKQYPKITAQLRDVHAQVPEAEAYNDFQSRIRSALSTIEQSDLRRIAIMTHGGPIRLVYRDILKLGEIDIADSAYVCLEVGTGMYRVVESEGITVAGH